MAALNRYSTSSFQVGKSRFAFRETPAPTNGTSVRFAAASINDSGIFMNAQTAENVWQELDQNPGCFRVRKARADCMPGRSDSRRTMPHCKGTLESAVLATSRTGSL